MTSVEHAEQVRMSAVYLINKFMTNCLTVGIIVHMNPGDEVISFEEFKRWILSRDPLRCERPMQEQIVLALQDVGFQRIRVTQVIHHPVWNVSANIGTFQADSLRSVKMALKKICGEIGFRVSLNEIVASLYHGRLNAAFALMPPNAVPVEVEDDGQRIPDHLEFEGAV